jgi:replication factor C subunit 3/5
LSVQLNASDDRGIDVVRNQIKTFASTRTVFRSASRARRVALRPFPGLNQSSTGMRRSGAKLVILDEADAMTNEAQAALRRGWVGNGGGDGMEPWPDGGKG